MSEHRDDYSGADINTVLTTVQRIATDGNLQLSILTHSLVIACKSTKVDRDVLFREIDKLWDRNDQILPLPRTQ